MSLFETRVQSLRPLFEEGARPIEAPRAELPPSKAHAGLILQNEARCELGGPGHASALALLYTNSKAKDCARLIGRSLAEVGTDGADFALVLVAGGAQLDAETFYQLTVRFPRLADHPGWMVKTDKSTVWVRAGAGDPSQALSVAAASLTACIRETFDKVESVELYFVIGQKELVEKLHAAGEDCRELMRELKTGVWKERGFDYTSCQLAGHCGSCSDKKTCASVRRMQAQVRMVRRQKTKEDKEEQPCTK